MSFDSPSAIEDQIAPATQWLEEAARSAYDSAAAAAGSIAPSPKAVEDTLKGTVDANIVGSGPLFEVFTQSKGPISTFAGKDGEATEDAYPELTPIDKTQLYKCPPDSPDQTPTCNFLVRPLSPLGQDWNSDMVRSIVNP